MSVRIIFDLLKLSVACTVVLSLSACGTVASRNFANRVMEDARRDITTLKNESPDGPFCDDGTYFTNSGVIYAVTPKATAAGLRLGDRIVAVNGRREVNAKQLDGMLAANYPGNTVTLMIDRTGTEIEINVVCNDGSAIKAAHLRVLEATSRGDWKGCEAAAQELIQNDGRKASFVFQYLLICREAERALTGRELSSFDARLRYDVWRMRLEEARLVPDGVTNIRGQVLEQIEILRISGFQSFAQELRAELQKQPLRKPETTSPPPSAHTRSQGTCFAIDPDGGVLTASHVVKDAREIWVSFASGQREKAVIERSAIAVDITLLRLNRKLETYLPLVSTRSTTPGERVFTIGFPATQVLGLEPKFTDGSISSLSGVRGESSLMQITVPIQPGNSGGPLMNEQGEVLGVITSSAAISPFLASTGSLPQNVNWAVKSDFAMPLLGGFDRPQVASTRDDAIKQGMSAVCYVEAISR